MGFWFGLGAAVFVVVALQILVWRPAAEEKKLRADRNLAQGILECAIRFPQSTPGSLRDRWANGIGQIIEGRFSFQGLDAGEYNRRMGGQIVVTEITAEGVQTLPGKRPREVLRNWKLLTLGSRQGVVEVAGSPNALQMPKERSSAQKAPDL